MKQTMDSNNRQSLPDSISQDMALVFEKRPCCALLIRANAPEFTMVAASDKYILLTSLTRKELIANSVLDLFSGETNEKHILRQSLVEVISQKETNISELGRYLDLRVDNQNEGYPQRWLITNTPVFKDDAVAYIIHSVEDVTGKHEAERKLRQYDAVMSTTPDFAYVFDLQHRFIYANPALLRMWGRSWDDAIGKTCLELGYEPWHAAMHDREIEQVIATHQPIRGEVPFKGTQGRRIYDYIFTPVIGSDGNVVAVAGTTRDITERKEAEDALQAAKEALSKSEGQLHQITNAIPQQVWTALPDGRLDYINAFCHEYTGDIQIENGIVNWIAVIHPDDIANSLKVWQNALESKDFYEVEQRIFHKQSNDYRWNLSRATAVKDAEGNVVKWYGTNTDIHDRKLAEQAVQEGRRLAEAANVAKTEFLANMSHEIRTPMNAVVGLTNILSKSKPLTLKQCELISYLQTSADSLLSLIDDLLDITKIEARKLDLERVEFSVVQLVQEVVSIMRVRAQEKDLAFTFEQKCECIEKRVFIGDPNRLRQILLNLCSNAIKFTEKGGVHVDILCETTADSKIEMIHLAVKDTGIGIEPEKSKVIFDKFVQADSSTNRKYGGTGLGLSISKMLAESMNGTISMDSRPGEGSEFRLSVPLEIVDALELSNPNSQLEKNYEESEGQTGNCILLVDDQPTNVVVACEFLKQFGYSFVVASNGYEAIDKIKEGKFSALLMDVQMPGMNGLEATSVIRAYEQHKAIPKIPIIGMTAHAFTNDRQNCLASGMDDYIAKPFNPDELRHKIEAAIKLRQADESTKLSE